MTAEDEAFSAAVCWSSDTSSRTRSSANSCGFFPNFPLSTLIVCGHDINTGFERVQLLVLFLFTMPRTHRDQSLDNEEDFDFNVDGSDSENDIAPARVPAPALHRAVTQVINDPEPCSKSGNAAYDVWHYFEKIKNDNGEDKARCRVCKYVVHFQLSFFL